MPRRNRNIPHKKAEEAAEYSMLLNPNLELYVYREINGGWYLTSRSPNK